MQALAKDEEKKEGKKFRTIKTTEINRIIEEYENYKGECKWKKVDSVDS
jgi:hypothetical protein